ncbi:MAG: hypothetical protein WCT28_04190 [Patescibacteria group bacterium]|jgi:hypothetical protein
MLSKNDVQLLRGMFEENNQILKREIRDETYSIVKGEVAALRRDMLQMRDDILDVINEGILPQIEEHRIDIARLKVVTGIA